MTHNSPKEQRQDILGYHAEDLIDKLGPPKLHEFEDQINRKTMILMINKTAVNVPAEIQKFYNSLSQKEKTPMIYGDGRH